MESSAAVVVVVAAVVVTAVAYRSSTLYGSADKRFLLPDPTRTRGAVD